MKAILGIFIIALTFSICLSSCKKDEPAAPLSYYSIRGKVFSAKDTSEYLQGVIVSSGSQSDTTDTNGLYYIKNAAGGSITLSFRYPDFRNKDTVISLTSDTSVSAGLVRAQQSIFPNETGNTWKYRVIDSIYNRNDTVLVQITGSGYFPDGRKGKIWRYTGKVYPNDNSYLYRVGSFNDTVFFNSEIEYIFPLTIGKKWHQHFQTTEVQAIETVTTSAGTFENCYKIYVSENGDNYRFSRTLWFAPGIGMIKEIRSLYSLGRVEYTFWQLLDYKLE